jgi:hypothetical protein
MLNNTIIIRHITQVKNLAFPNTAFYVYKISHQAIFSTPKSIQTLLKNNYLTYKLNCPRADFDNLKRQGYNFNHSHLREHQANLTPREHQANLTPPQF